MLAGTRVGECGKQQSDEAAKHCCGHTAKHCWKPMVAGVALVWGSGRNHPSISGGKCPSSFGREYSMGTRQATHPIQQHTTHSQR